ncbi:two-component system sensor histidine kinase CreC [Leptospira jelokensis]|uniref:two-component system sensor histidine kinase CreC n=1 Tax=Leptospira jelokensis TaxID=2484931 RepID=UPI0010912D54|nr:two-component system sensor histidine kinase CreC [Leptospira jelokensis]TGM01707.1 two-component system sensor histidine kinase CreC [Leptospira jelokensis]
MVTNHYQFFFILCIGFYYLIDKTEESIRPRYMETIEESLNDTTHVLSAIVEEEIKKNPNDRFQLPSLVKRLFQKPFQNVRKRSFEAKIYSLLKTNADIQIYVTDSKGIVIFDSEDFREGLDYSKYNDVYLTLKGKYGVRSSKMFDSEKEGALFIASPIHYQNEIIGVLTVIKPKIGVIPFIEEAKNKFWRISLLVASSIAIVFTILAYISFRPIIRLSQYVISLRNQEKKPFPKLGIKELNDLGKEVDQLVSELEGKKYVESYVQTLTHEIKSPLSSILASVELIESHPNEIHRLSKTMEAEAKRIQSLIDQLLELSSLEGKKSIELDDQINLVPFLEGVIHRFEIELERKNLQVKKIFPNDVIRIKGNESYLKMAIENILRNAIEFANPKDQITIQLELIDQSHTKLIVSDEGQSIPNFALAKVTEKFFSLPRPSDKRKSSGLGLSIVKEILDLHQAEFTIRNLDPKGVEVSIQFQNF